MEEIKLNMQNLTKEEREQLLKLINKANERADLESKKQELLKRVLDNYKAFYGDNYNKMRNHISVFTRLAKDTIDEFLDNGNYTAPKYATCTSGTMSCKAKKTLAGSEKPLYLKIFLTILAGLIKIC